VAVGRFILQFFEELVAGIFMVLMSLATFSNVVARYAFNSPIQWAEEFSRYSFIWVVFLGAVVCTKRNRHIAIDSLLTVLPRAWQSRFRVAVHVCGMGLMAVIAYYGILLTLNATQTTATLKVPHYAVYVVVPMSAMLIFLYSLRDLQRDLSGRQTEGDN
jgi:TRAP-type C4-dicarboxylate transport system permease small subunit